MFSKKGVLKNFTKFTGKHLCQISFLIKLLLKKRPDSCEFCGIFKNTFFREQLRATASERCWRYVWITDQEFKERFLHLASEFVCLWSVILQFTTDVKSIIVCKTMSPIKLVFCAISWQETKLFRCRLLS